MYLTAKKINVDMKQEILVEQLKKIRPDFILEEPKFIIFLFFTEEKIKMARGYGNFGGVTRRFYSGARCSVQFS